MRSFISRALALGILSIAVSANAQQQATGRVVGQVIDAATGKGLVDVGVQISGTTLGAMSGVDGRFTINNVSAGTVTLQARRIGFAPKSVTGIVVNPGSAPERERVC